MTPTEAIAPTVLSAATQGLTASSEFCARLGWWLQGGHSSERWMQFEWAYRLQQEVSPSFAVLCEHQRLDVSLVQSPHSVLPLWKADPVAGVELKWWGNWWVDGNAVKNLEADLTKVEGRNFPAVALLLLLFVDPGADPVRAWIAEQIEDGKGVRDVASLHNNHLSRLARAADHESSIDLPGDPTLPAGSLHLFAFFNRCARERLVR